MAQVRHTYDQCLCCLYHNPEMWMEFATWHLVAGRTDAAVRVLQRACKALPTCLMLQFALADVEEERGNLDRMRMVYDGLLMSDVRDAPKSMVSIACAWRATG